MDADFQGAAVSEVHPALAVGRRWAGILEAEDFLVGASVAAPGDSLLRRAHHE
jgi:hypothetical protein